MCVGESEQVVVSWKGLLGLSDGLRDEVGEEAFAEGGEPSRHGRLIRMLGRL